MRRFVLSFILLALVACLPAGAEDAWKVDVTAGLAGKIPSDGSLFPVFVRVKNENLNATGRIVLRSDDLNPEVYQEMPIESPKGSNKRFVVLTRMQDHANLMVAVEWDQNLPPTPPVKFSGERLSDLKGLILGVGLPTDKKVSPYGGMATNKDYAINERYAFVRADARELVDMPLAYDGVDALIIDSLAFAKLEQPVADALADWVQLGGVLIFFGPYRGNDFVDRLTPFPVKVGELSDDGLVRCGIGWLAVDCMDITSKPVWLDDSRIEEAKALFPRILEGTGTFYASFMTTLGKGGIFGLLTKKEGTYGFRGFMWLTLIILSYLAVIGPLDWWLVKKLGKPYLTWFFFVGAIATFSAVAYWYSSLVHTDTMEAVKLTVLDASLNGDQARGDTLYWIYSPKNFRYEFTTDKENMIYTVREQNGALVGKAATATIRNGIESTLEAKIPIFSSKTVDCTWIEPWEMQFSADTLDGRRVITVPDGLRIRSIELANMKGLTTLQPGDTQGTWVAVGKPQPWETVLSGYSSTGLDDAYFDDVQRDGLPSREKLEGLIRFASFAAVDNRKTLGKKKKDDDTTDPGAGDNTNQFDPNQGMYTSDPRAMIAHTMEYMDGREVAMNVRGRTRATGEMLLIFLEDDVLHDLKVNGLPPQQQNVNVIRLQLP